MCCARMTSSVSSGRHSHKRHSSMGSRIGWRGCGRYGLAARSNQVDRLFWSRCGCHLPQLRGLVCAVRISYGTSRQCDRDGARACSSLHRCVVAVVRRHGCFFLVLERHEGIRQRRLHLSLRWPTHRSHLSSPGDIVSSGACFDEFGRLHSVRYLQAYFDRFQMCVRYGFEASGMESVIASFVLHRSFAKMFLSQPAKVPLLRCVVAMVRSRGHGSGDCNVYASSRSHQGMPGGPRFQSLTRCFGLFRAVCSLQTLSARFLCHVRCGFEVCGVAPVNGEFVFGRGQLRQV